MSFIPALRRRLRRSDNGQDHIVWDVPNPFAPPDPHLAHLRLLLDQEIARTRRYESIAPNEPVDDQVTDHSDDADNEEDEDTDEHADKNQDEPKPGQIILPCLLPLPPRSIPHDATSIHSETQDRERAARKAKRDIHRSRAKALAVLGPEATEAIHATL